MSAARPVRRRARAASAAVLCGLGGLGGVVLPATPASAADDACTESRPAPVYVAQRSPALTQMGVASVWKLATGRGVTVAIVDSGIDVGNAHLPVDTAVTKGRTLLPAIDGWTPDPVGRNDLSGHGTAVASLVAGRSVDTSGQVGLAYGAKLVPVQVFGVATTDPSSDPRLAAVTPTVQRLADGIRAGVDLGAKVVNVSLSVDTPDPVLAAAVAYAASKGALVVASAGDRESAPTAKDGARYPAAFPGVVSVTSVTSSRGVDTAANIQGPHITVAAVGQGLNTALGHVGDCLLTGAPATSFATPLVSATAALLAERFPEEGPALWKYRIEASAQRPRASVRDAALGWGIVSPYDALTMTLDPSRPGPTMPGHDAPATATPAQAVGPVVLDADPDAGPRQVGLWLAFAAVAAAVGLRLLQVLRRRPSDTTYAPSGLSGPGGPSGSDGSGAGDDRDTSR
ncbi:MAG: S8 family serine peptidase [Lapillicoccus sp.]